MRADLSVSSFIAHSFNLGYVLPFASCWRFSADVVRQVNDFHSSSSFSESVQGLGFGWSCGSHRFGLDAHLRDIHPLVTLVGAKTVASEQLRRVPLRTIKTGFSYDYNLDRALTEACRAVGGYKVGLRGEICGLFGDVNFAKCEASYSLYRRVWRGLVYHGSVGGGAIGQLGKSVTPIQDRFFIGGTSEQKYALRGFASRSVGPSGKRILAAPAMPGDKLVDHLGGEAFVSMDNVISFPVAGVYAMAFLQAGSLLPSLHSSVSKNTRVCAGVGVMVPVGNMGTAEITLGRPIFGRQTTDTVQSLQIGLRISM